jgi:RimJ/RimL family protein N-acetyltransferase/GrpB-like predicted nucleotidyltransferase (UPF0157 family)
MPEQLPFPDPQLRDEAVLLRPLAAADVPLVAAICRDPDVQRWTSVPEDYREQDARDFLIRAEEARLRGDELQQALADPGDNRLVGAVGLEVSSQHAIGQIGYYLGPDGRGRGLATRAVGLVAGWAVRTLGLRRVEILAHPDNLPSQRVALRAGFQREGLMRSYRERKGQREDLWMFSLLPPELEAAAVRFVPLEDVQQQVAELRERYCGRLAMLLPEADVQEIGATTLPGAITKGDLDLLVRVPAGAFVNSRGALGRDYAVHQLENWTPSFASFKAAAREPDVGIHLVVEESPDDLLLRGSRDALLGDPALLERYNALKREHEGSDPDAYWRAKTAFFESLGL